MSETDVAELAYYDQCLANTDHSLTELVEIFRNTRTEEPEHYAVIGLVLSLRENLDAELMSELLAVAIKRIANSSTSS